MYIISLFPLFRSIFHWSLLEAHLLMQVDKDESFKIHAYNRIAIFNKFVGVIKFGNIDGIIIKNEELRYTFIQENNEPPY